ATGGHLLVLVGFEDDDHIAVNDPAYRDPEKGQRTYLREDLENVWMRARGGLAYVLLPRK
ncbi:MAG: peptidase C39 family protein, partial [Planctomycetes bacterium]|nr:peptidase C39 family protein [Planctomycetota bacterium]